MDAIIGHEPVLRELRRLALGPEPPHALLIDGPASTGRNLLALFYARLLNCAARSEPGRAADSLPCGECRACRLISSGNHADVIQLGPGDTLCRPRSGDSAHDHSRSREIAICQVRGVIDLVSRYPLEGPYRVIVIDPAESFGRDAAHTVLKTLEEPPPQTAFVLVTAAPDQLLETIISRCRRVVVYPVPREEIERGLIERGIDPGIADRAAEQARGRPGIAITLASEPGLLDDFDRKLDRCAELAAAGMNERFQYASSLSDRWRSDSEGVLSELGTWESFWEAALREAAAADDPDAARDANRALQAIAVCRDDLQAHVIPIAAIELMLLSFPRRRLDEAHAEEPTHA